MNKHTRLLEEIANIRAKIARLERALQIKNRALANKHQQNSPARAHSDEC